MEKVMRMWCIQHRQGFRFLVLDHVEDMMIDTSFDFTTDTKGFWDGFWYRKGGLGYCGNDPDSCSARLREYHRILWSRELPNGQVMGPISCLLLAFHNRSVLNLPGLRNSAVRFVLSSIFEPFPFWK